VLFNGKVWHFQFDIFSRKRSTPASASSKAHIHFYYIIQHDPTKQIHGSIQSHLSGNQCRYTYKFDDALTSYQRTPFNPVASPSCPSTSQEQQPL
jgi:hypothetical protein